MYIRIKKRKTKLGTTDYAYETKSIRTKQGPRQKVISYLGKVHYFEDSLLTLPFYLGINDLGLYFSDKNLKITVKELIIFELIRYGFSKENNLLVKDGFIINLDDKTVVSQSNNAVLRINNGYLCTKTLKKCFEDIEKESNIKKLIKSLLLVGINPGNDQFMRIFRHKI